MKIMAERHRVNCKTLENRWKCKSVSMEEAVSTYCQAFTNSQEKALVGIINRLTDYRKPLTSAIVKNLAEEIKGSFVKKS